MKRTGSCIASAVLCIALAVLTVTVSIGLPIYVRPFYYAHIQPMKLPEQTGYTAQQIRQGYDRVLDYLTLPGREFDAGVFAYSPEGASHFADCKGLFDLNLTAMVLSAGLLLVLWLLHKKKVICLHPKTGLWAGVLTLTAFTGIGALAALDFDRAFTVFHRIFFPGKDNWIFDPAKDEIIRVLPQDFFMHCAILIGAAVILISLALIVSGLKNQGRCPK